MSTIVRKNIDNYTTAELAALRLAYTKMQALSDNRGFNYIAGFHGLPDKFCYHHEDPLMFFPWHRGYLLAFEQRLRDIDPATSLPYWDWTSPTAHKKGVPAAFKVKKSPGGAANPLANSLMDVPAAHPPLKRRTGRSPGPASELPTATEVANLLKEPDFITFSNGVQDLHDGVHGWTGGDMGQIPTAAYDPIFFSHHAMIDRIWARWQELYGITNVPASILARPLRGMDNMTVASVLDFKQLGYTYASDVLTVLNIA